MGDGEEGSPKSLQDQGSRDGVSTRAGKREIASLKKSITSVFSGREREDRRGGRESGRENSRTPQFYVTGLGRPL